MKPTVLRERGAFGAKKRTKRGCQVPVRMYFHDTCGNLAIGIHVSIDANCLYTYKNLYTMYTGRERETSILACIYMYVCTYIYIYMLQMCVYIYIYADLFAFACMHIHTLKSYDI